MAARAARSSSMPAPLTEEVASRTGKAAGWAASSTQLASRRAAKAAGLTLSALVKTTWKGTAASSSSFITERSLSLIPWRASISRQTRRSSTRPRR